LKPIVECLVAEGDACSDKVGVSTIYWFNKDNSGRGKKVTSVWGLEEK